MLLLSAFCMQCPNFNALSIISLLAAIMSLTYSTIAIGGSLAAGRQPGAKYDLDGRSFGSAVLNVFNALGVVAFACELRNQLLHMPDNLAWLGDSGINETEVLPASLLRAIAFIFSRGLDAFIAITVDLLYKHASGARTLLPCSYQILSNLDERAYDKAALHRIQCYGTQNLGPSIVGVLTENVLTKQGYCITYHLSAPLLVCWLGLCSEHFGGDMIIIL